MPYQLLLDELKRNPSRPFLTYYDDATGERVELSVATFDNWVAKTAGLLRDGLSVAPGDRVAISLPAHWQALVWTMACWAAGLEVRVAGAEKGTTLYAEGAEVAVTGPEISSQDDKTKPAADVVALSLRPLGGRFAEPLPAGVLDYAVEVPSYPDHFIPFAPPAPDDPALTTAAATQSFRGLMDHAQDRATTLSITNQRRMLVAANELVPAVIDALLVPLAIGGSAVLVRNENTDLRHSRVEAERADFVIAHSGPGISGSAEVIP